MELFKWMKGRQENVEYHKWCFLHRKIGRYGFDGYILKYEDHVILDTHIDPINGKHYRLNINLKGKSIFKCDKCIIRWGDRLALFRPDIRYHNLVVLTKTYKLSLGFAKFNKHETSKD